MLNQFISQTVNFLSKSGMQLPEFILQKVEIDNDGKTTHYLELSDTLFGSSIPNNIILQSMLVFAVLDAKVDVLQSAFIGKKLFEKYDALPDSSDGEIIFKEFYRILRIIRNKAIHNMGGISIVNNNVEVLNEMRISESALRTIYSYVLDTLCGYKVPSALFMGLLRTVYDNVVNSTTILRGSPLLSISNGLRLKWNRHLRIVDSNYQVSNGRLIISDPNISKHPSDGCDYEFDYMGKKYLLPEEVLDSQLSISLLELQEWEN